MKLKIYLAAHDAAVQALDAKTPDEVKAAKESGFSSTGSKSQQDFALFTVYFDDEFNKMRGIANGKAPSELAAQTV